MRLLAILVLAIMAGCASPPTSVTPKPNITPVIASNTKIRESSAKIKVSGQKTLKYNQDIQQDLSAAENAINHLLSP
jgi:uncharacterized lipoprotein YajG